MHVFSNAEPRTPHAEQGHLLHHSPSAISHYASAMSTPSSTSDPERDRRLAHKARLGPRYATPLGDVVSWVMNDAEMQRRKRFLKVTGALKSVLTEQQLGRIKPTAFMNGILTIDVRDGMLLAELKQHLEARLLDACAQAGTGVTRIRWRLARGQFL